MQLSYYPSTRRSPRSISFMRLSGSRLTRSVRSVLFSVTGVAWPADYRLEPQGRPSGFRRVQSPVVIHGSDHPPPGHDRGRLCLVGAVEYLK